MKNSILLLLTLMMFVSCKQQTSKNQDSSETEVVKNSIQLLDVNAFKTVIKANNIQLIDVRTPEEFAEGHIEGAVNIDFLADDFSEAILKVNKEQPVYIYCRSGGRSGQAAIQMKKLGFKTINDLKGGFLAWE